MTPVKEVTFAKLIERRTEKAVACVEQAVGDVDGPDTEREQRGHPQRKQQVCNPGEGERPDQRDGWRVEAGQVPEAQGSGCFKGASVAGGDAHVGEELRHFFNCRRERGVLESATLIYGLRMMGDQLQGWASNLQ